MNPKVETIGAPLGEYDLVLAACGYEQRSRFMLEALDFFAETKVAIGYGMHEKIAFRGNKRAFESSGFELLSPNDDAFEGIVRTLVSGQESGRPVKRVLVDISCFTRLRLAGLIRALSDASGLQVDFFYSLAEFSSPSTDDPINDHLGPASEYFAGWSAEYVNPTVVISGLGYEYMKALGVIELVDPSSSWLFFPSSPLVQYEDAVRKANGLLLRDVDRSRVVNYDVLDAPALVRDLFSLVDFLRKRYRCVLLPLGPKIFAFCAMLAGSYFRDVAVWRASAGKYAKPSDRRASEHYALFRVSF